MSLIELKNEALKLSLKERAELARELLRSVDDPTDAEYDALWLEEVGRRVARVERGESQLIPLEEVLKRAQAIRAKSA
jgi:putative addiction module component (TIGR02574 family)